MKAVVHGHISGPVVAVVGSYDPFLPEHRQLMEQLGCYAHQHSLSAVAIVLDPAPPLHLYGPSEWPVYEDVNVRIHRMLRCGLDGVLRIRFFKKDLNATAADFFALAGSYFRIEELWLGGRQTLGVGPGGSQRTIAELAEQQGIRLDYLSRPGHSTSRLSIHHFLMTGCISEASNAIGHPPVRSRPKSGKLRLAWSPGCYRVVPLDRLDAAVTGPALELTLTPEATGLPGLQWPDRRIKYLAFVSGPGDQSQERG